MIRFQASVQSKLEPAVWFAWSKSWHYEEEKWTATLSKAEMKEKIIHMVNSLDNFEVANQNEESLKVFWYSPGWNWLDITKFKFEEVEDNVEVQVKSASSGICPLCIPGAPFINVILSFLPFVDANGMLCRNLKTIRTGIEKKNSMNIKKESKVKSQGHIYLDKALKKKGRELY